MWKFWLVIPFIGVCHAAFAQLLPYYPLLKRDQKVLTEAFQGGANNPQYNLADLDADGQNEMVVLDKAGDAVQVYRYLRDSKAYKLAPDLLTILPDSLNRWLLIKDMNKDNVPDLFTNSIVPGIPGITVYVGSYENRHVSFKKFLPNQGRLEVLSYQNNNGNWINVYVSPEDLPAIEDMDGDGDLDILSFEPGGSSIYYYENQASGSELFHFRLGDACWGKVTESGLSSMMFLSQNPEICASSGLAPLVIRHAGSSLLALDLDNDADKDLIVGDVGSVNLTALINGGTKTKAYVTSQIQGFPAESTPVGLTIYPFPFKGDFDYDGIPDLLVSPGDIFNSENINVTWFYKNIGSITKPVFQLQSKQFLTEFIFDGGSEACPAFLDYNADGLMDLIVGTKGYFPNEITGDPRFILILNRGSLVEPIFEVVNNNYLNINRFKNETAMLSPSAVDFDADGDIDLLCGDFFGTLVYFENLAGPGKQAVFAEPVFQFLGIDVGANAMPAMVDVNLDRLPDLFVGERNGNINYFQNNGLPGQPKFNLLPDEEHFAGIDTRLPGFVTGYSTPSVLEGKDKKHLVSGSVHGRTYIYEQVGKQWLANHSLLQTKKNGSNTFIDFADLDGDDFLEMVVGNRRGGLNFYHTTLPVSESTSVYPEKDIDLAYYPNPVNHILHFNTHDMEQGHLTIYNVQGVRVSALDKFYVHASINTSSWPTGLYLMQYCVRGKTKVFKVFKSH